MHALSRRFGYRTRHLFAVASILCLGGIARADEERLVPLNTLGERTYRGFVGGLYPEGRNAPTGTYADALRRVSEGIRPLDREGKPDPRGKIVVAGIGASVCRQIFAAMESQAPALPGLNPAVVVVNCAGGGQDVNKIADPSQRYWTQAEAALTARGLTPSQVQVAWYQSDDLRDTRDDFPGRPRRLLEQLAEQLRLMKTHFPNVRLCYFSARHNTYFVPDTGSKAKHGEPRPYHNGWAVKWLIEDQIGGRADLRFEGEDAVAPLAAWATYFWTDGNTPRPDGYRWTRDDVVADGVHLSESARVRVAGELLTFFSGDRFARTWFSKSPAATDPTASVEEPAWIVNGKDKRPKLLRLLGSNPGEVRVVVRDLTGKRVAEVEDILHKRIDLNMLVGPGDYKIEFLDHEGKPIKLSQEVGEVLRLK